MRSSEIRFLSPLYFCNGFYSYTPLIATKTESLCFQLSIVYDKIYS
jgi:hypothetical protein